MITGPAIVMAWVALMAAPAPDAAVTLGACPGYEQLGACSFPDGRVYVSDNPFWPERTRRVMLYHELGHEYERTVSVHRRRHIYHLFHRVPDWRLSRHDFGEWFADAYSNCALDALPGSWRWVDGYGYEPSRHTAKVVCGLIRTARLRPV